MDIIDFLKSNKILFWTVVFLISVAITSFLDTALAAGIILIAILIGATFLVILKIGIKSRALIFLLLITILVHFAFVLFIHYANFQPFSGGDGDYRLYDDSAKIIAERLHRGNFSIGGLSTGNFLYPIIIGYVYALTLPEMFIGQLLNAWLAVISTLLVYLIILQIGGSKEQAFFTGLIACFYPSYLFFGSLLLKDTVVIPLVLGALLLILKLIKNFSWKNFTILYIILWAVINFRFYVGYALLLTFIPCWLLLCKIDLKKKIIYGAIIVVLLGFLPQSFGDGYYGSRNINYFLDPTVITYYRELTYASSPAPVAESPAAEAPKAESPAAEAPKAESPAAEAPKAEAPKVEIPKTEAPVAEVPSIAEKTFLNKLILKLFPNIEKTPVNSSSTIQVKTEINKPLNFLINWSKSFIYILLGPLPWQIQNYRQLFALLETIPWYFLLFFIIRGAFATLKQKRIALPLLVFSIISIGVLALFVPNFGLTTRIRIPSFIALSCLLPLGLTNIKNVKINLLNRIVLLLRA